MSGRRPSLAAAPNGSRERQGRHRGRRQGQEGRRGDQGIVELPRSARRGAAPEWALAAAAPSQAEESQQEGTGGREVMSKKGKHKQDRDGIVASLLPWSRGRIPPPAGTAPGPYVPPAGRTGDLSRLGRTRRRLRSYAPSQMRPASASRPLSLRASTTC